jgi:hypothetical protein
MAQLALKKRALLDSEKNKGKRVPDTSDSDLLLRKFIDFNLPVRATFLDDVMGYGFLAAGHHYEARIMFKDCIEIDPQYASAYLHLGDYFYYRSVVAPKEETDEGNYRWHGKLCYYITKYLEEKNNSIASRRYRQAEERLGLK